jgi:hypothetical protein
LLTDTSGGNEKGFWWHIKPSISEIYLRVEDTNGPEEQVTISKALSLNRWYHVAFTIYTNKVIMYLDGQELYNWTVDFSWSLINSDNLYFWIGTGYNNSYWYKGYVDEVSLYRTVLSPQEIFYKANFIRQSGYPIAKIANPANDATFSLSSGSVVVNFSATGSSDSYGAPAGLDSYFWNFGDGTPIIKRGDTVAVTYTQAGDKVVQLWVIDKEGNPSKAVLGSGLINIHISPTLNLFQRVDNLKKK